MLVQQNVEVMSLFLMAMGVRYTIKIQARVGEYLKTLRDEKYKDNNANLLLPG